MLAADQRIRLSTVVSCFIIKMINPSPFDDLHFAIGLAATMGETSSAKQNEDDGLYIKVRNLMSEVDQLHRTTNRHPSGRHCDANATINRKCYQHLHEGPRSRRCNPANRYHSTKYQRM
uniref:Uncharacterized protein n=1 Tax=Spongospora subterranea TaxID=70186 RepID=A0A0H5QNY3_9EUKA|eukprot:CRZ03810.1 hypothetical protein [Spongospora subterranea]